MKKYRIKIEATSQTEENDMRRQRREGKENAKGKAASMSFSLLFLIYNLFIIDFGLVSQSRYH